MGKGRAAEVHAECSVGLCLRSGAQSLGNFESYMGADGKPSQTLPRREIFLYYFGQKTSLPSFLKEDTIIVFQDYLLLEENIGRTLYDINHSKILFDPPPREMKIKT